MKIKTQFLPTLVCGLIVAASPAIRAEDAPASPAPSTPAHHGEKGKGEHGEAPLERLTKALDLTGDQKTKIKSIFEERRENVKAVREDATLSDEQKKEKAKEIIQSSTGKIKALLTPEQQTKFEKVMEEMKSRRKPPGKE